MIPESIAPLFVGGMPGGMELAVILLIAVLLFGANKIPKLARSTGQAMGEFKRGREEIEDEISSMTDVEGESGGAEEATTADTQASAGETDDTDEEK